MYRSPHKLIGLISIGALGLVIGVAACTQPGATPTAMMEASPTGMMMEASPTGMMMEASPTGMMMEASPSAMMEASPTGMMMEASPSAGQ